MRFWRMRQPADYRRKAAKYLAMARCASSYERCMKCYELASLYLAQAEIREKTAAEWTAYSLGLREDRQKRDFTRGPEPSGEGARAKSATPSDVKAAFRMGMADPLAS